MPKYEGEYRHHVCTTHAFMCLVFTMKGIYYFSSLFITSNSPLFRALEITYKVMDEAWDRLEYEDRHWDELH